MIAATCDEVNRCSPRMKGCQRMKSPKCASIRPRAQMSSAPPHRGKMQGHQHEEEQPLARTLRRTIGKSEGR